MMMTTALMAMVGSLAAALTPAPAWQPDYPTACAQSSNAHKPLAVFIGHGSSGASSVVAKGLTADENKTLADKFVVLYVDAESTAGKTLAASFQISEGLVISDATGGLQALKHGGSLTQEELTGYLVKYSDPTRPVTTTDAGGTFHPAPVSVDPIGRYMTFGGKSSCPNCRN
ncbi:MAG TPA: hypothetical protein VGJ05_13915 [Fimbriiglobus sp.]|jgi:hypothetical protein